LVEFESLSDGESGKLSTDGVRMKR